MLIKDIDYDYTIQRDRINLKTISELYQCLII